MIRRWALRIAHWTVFVLTAFVLMLLTAPLLAYLIGGLQSALGPAAPATKDLFFFVWIPCLAIATVWTSRRFNRRLDRRFGGVPRGPA